jgi:hypothetical protein
MGSWELFSQADDIATLLISASQVTRITGVSYHRPAAPIFYSKRFTTGTLFLSLLLLLLLFSYFKIATKAGGVAQVVESLHSKQRQTLSGLTV